MRIPAPTSHSGRKTQLAFWDVCWALACPIVALYLRDAEIISHDEWGVVGPYLVLSAVFSLAGFIAFRIQDGMPCHFSVHDSLAIVKAVVFAELVTCIVLFLF